MEAVPNLTCKTQLSAILKILLVMEHLYWYILGQVIHAFIASKSKMINSVVFFSILSQTQAT